MIIELKILHKSRERTIDEGMAQAWRYADRSGADEVHLILFDRTVGKPWEDKVFCETRTYEPDGEEGFRYPVIVWGM